MYVFGNNRNRTIPIRNSPSSLSLVDLFKQVSISTFGKGMGWVESPEKQKERHKQIVNHMVKHPLISPVHCHDLSGLPPCLIQSGEAEVLRDESLILATRFHASNLHSQKFPGAAKMSFVRHEMYKDMVHVFLAMQWLPISDIAMKNVRRFIYELEDMDAVDLENQVH
jgi:acetyl esterase/lipase